MREDLAGNLSGPDTDPTIQDLNGVDAPGNTSTTQVLAVGGYVAGTATPTDHDWYRVTLVAGQHYAFETDTFERNGQFPQLTLHNASGAQVAVGGDGPSEEALMNYTPTTGGTYFIEVSQNPAGEGVFLDYILGMGQAINQSDTVGESPGTAGVVLLGGSVDGVIEALPDPNGAIFGDQDWYAVNLTAGQHYIFTLTGLALPGASPLLDPQLEIYDLHFNPWAEINNGGQGLNAALRFTPVTSGTYYVSAEGHMVQTGGYHLTAATVAAQDPLATINAGVTTNPVVKIYFAHAGETFGGVTATDNWSTSQIAATLAAGAAFSAVANLSFTQVFSAAQATTVMVQDASLETAISPTDVGNVTGDALPGAPAVDVFSPLYLTDDVINPGGFGFAFILHELGHDLGLAHPYDGSALEIMEGLIDSPWRTLNDTVLWDYGAYDLNQGVFTIMSENFGEPRFWGNNPGLQVGPMGLDIALLQQKYGATSHNTGDDVYDLTSVPGRVVTIWDTGGNDTLDGSSISGRAVIDLRPATLQSEVGGGGYVSGGSGGGYTIAAGVTIENAIGGSDNDRLIGNDGANTLNGGLGNDFLDGGAGSDTASYVGASSGVTVNLSITTAQDTGGAGSDTLISIENLMGSSLNDTLTGDAGVNILIGGAGDDTLDGGTGATDYLYGQGGSDTVSYASNSSANIVIDLVAQNAWDGVAQDLLNSIENAIGSAGSDVIFGDGVDNVIDGGSSGVDYLRGFGGSNTVSYANDVSTGVWLDLGGETSWDGTSTDRLIEFQNAIGSSGNDVIFGTNDDNILDGGNGGIDYLYGFGGTDTVSYATNAVTVANTDTKEHAVGIDWGQKEDVMKVAPGKTISFECPDGCGVTGPWGFSWMAKGNDKISTNGQSLVDVGNTIR